MVTSLFELIKMVPGTYGEIPHLIHGCTSRPEPYFFYPEYPPAIRPKEAWNSASIPRGTTINLALIPCGSIPYLVYVTPDSERRVGAVIVSFLARCEQ